MYYLAIVSLIWAFSFGLIGNSLSGIDLFLVATLRLGCATLLFLPWLRLKTIAKNDCLRLIFYGAVQFGLMYTCYMKAYDHIPSHLVAIFSILTPIYVVLIHDLQVRSFSYRYLIAALVSILGAAIIRAKGTPLEDIWIGFGLMQIAGISFAYGQVSYRSWKRRNQLINDRDVFSLLTLGATLCSALFSLILTDWNGIEIQTSKWLSILYLGFIASGLGFFLWNKGAALCNTGTLAAFNNAVIPLAVICSLFFFGEIEHFSPKNLLRLALGSCLITLAVFISARKQGKISVKRFRNI